METRLLGNTGMSVSILGFGGAEIGYNSVDKSSVSLMLNKALDAGLNLIDTAECYSNGDQSSEELIGDAVSHRRSDYFLFTKCGHSSGLSTPDWHLDTITSSIERSLKRLKTDYIDLLQLHSCDLDVLKQGDVIETVQRACQAGKVRFIGYSGDNEEAQYAIHCGAFQTLQCSLNLFDQSPLEKTLPLAHKHNMGVIIKRPLGNVVWNYATTPPNSYHTEYWERSRILDYQSIYPGADQMMSTALKFTLSQPGVHTAIVGTTNQNRWKENAKILESGLMTDSELNTIRDIWKQKSTSNWLALR